VPVGLAVMGYEECHELPDSRSVASVEGAPIECRLCITTRSAATTRTITGSHNPLTCILQREVCAK
jgi:hypothetical protein